MKFRTGKRDIEKKKETKKLSIRESGGIKKW